MLSFNVKAEEKFDPKHHVEKILGTAGEGDVTVACWEPGQTSPYHCHPNAVELYFCFEGGGTMRTPTETRRQAGLLCRPSARRAARMDHRAATHPPLPRPLRRGDVGPHQGVAEQRRVETAAARCRVFRREVGDERRR
jgi:hypothetical protein